MRTVVIRTARVTITEAHPYHHYVSDHRATGGNAVVLRAYDAHCPLCRAERAQKEATR